MLNDSTIFPPGDTTVARHAKKIWMAHPAEDFQADFECLERTLLILLKKNSLPVEYVIACAVMNTLSLVWLMSNYGSHPPHFWEQISHSGDGRAAGPTGGLGPCLVSLPASLHSLHGRRRVANLLIQQQLSCLVRP